MKTLAEQKAVVEQKAGTLVVTGLTDYPELIDWAEKVRTCLLDYCGVLITRTYAAKAQSEERGAEAERLAEYVGGLVQQLWPN